MYLIKKKAEIEERKCFETINDTQTSGCVYMYSSGYNTRELSSRLNVTN